ncbi:sugar-binding transcriptional regulator [Microbacterium schleiferi]|uniref:Sugar-binding transcriptional regulator n=1 Tax=Microbacterium schleiferi TaxID=69362 RepID=A0A7S8MYH5_9MICO|nr:sugar-binding domain-containing protein [Microbacterium schleiferi]QPE05594.1 sugar-binding transcriptional regulator [Microbacterium schleiferi]
MAGETTRELHRVAHLYYVQQMTMEAIARDLSTSRSTVSRLIERARQLGIVTIQVHTPSDLDPQIHRALAQRFGVAMHVVPIPRGLNDIDTHDRVCAAAASLLPRFFSSGQNLGLAWGSTTNTISQHLGSHPLVRAQVVQLSGAGSATGVDFANDIMHRFGTAFSADLQHFPVPAFFDNPEAKKIMWRERSVSRILALHTQLDVALFGIGSPRAEVPSKVYRQDYLDKSDYDGLVQSGVVGDIATVFFRADGSTNDIPLNARSTGPSFDVLRRTPRRICVLSGKSKLLALRGALAAGLISDLIIDEVSAEWLTRSLG